MYTFIRICILIILYPNVHFVPSKSRHLETFLDADLNFPTVNYMYSEKFCSSTFRKLTVDVGAISLSSEFEPCS